MKKKQSILILILLVLFSFSAFSQVTTSALSGKVTGEDKSPLPGATIIAVHQPSGTQYGTIANADGYFNLQGMRPGGPYEVKIRFIGYNTNVITSLSLALGETYTMNIKMDQSTTDVEEVIVKGNADNTFNSSRTGAKTNISQEQLNSLPSISRSLNDYARLTPQAVVTNGGLSFSGSNNRYNSFQIDGTVNNDVFGLAGSGTNGGLAGTQPISLDAIQEIQVVIAPFDVRQGGFTGGGINAITKGGTNEFKGSVYAFGNNQNIIGKTAGNVADSLRTKLGTQRDYQIGASLGGAIIKNKLFFFLNAEISNKSYPTSYNVGDGSSITREEADLVVNKLKDLTGGYDGGGYDLFNIDTKSTKILARIDWNINDANKFSIRHSFVDANQVNFSRSKNALRLGDNGYLMVSKTNSTVAQLSTRISNATSNQLRIGFTSVKDYRDIMGEPFPYVKIELSGSRSIELGTERYSPANSLDQNIVTLTDDFSWFLGDHSITFGTHNELFMMKNLFIRENFGSYIYSSIADFQTIGTASEVLPKEFNYSLSNETVTGSKRWAPQFNAMQVGFYAQDEWKVMQGLKLTYGLRIDVPLFPDSPTENSTFNESSIALDNNAKNNQMPSSKPLWSPRLGFNWDVFGDRSTQVRGGTGLFTGRIPFVWISNSFSNSGIEYIRTRYTSKNMPADFKFAKDPNNQPAGSAMTSEIDAIDKNFKFPQVFRSNLAIDQKLPFGIKGTIEAIFSKKMNDIMYKNLNIAESGIKLNNFDDKRPLYGASISNAYTSVIYLTNTNDGYSYSITGKLEKDFDFGLNTMIAYTYGESKDLNGGTSSQAYSNWSYNEQYQGSNNPELSYSDFDIRHRVIGSLSYSKSYGKIFTTSIGLFYNGQSGFNYSFCYIDDINKDGVRGNDVLFVPTDVQIDQMKFIDIINSKDQSLIASVDKQKSDLKSYLSTEAGLKDMRGEYAERNSLTTPFENHFDLRITQDCKVNKKKNTIQITFDVLNIGNMFNKEWGLTYSPNYSYSILNISNIDTSTGDVTFQFSKPKSQPVYNINDFYSRWRAQIGLRYIF